MTTRLYVGNLEHATTAEDVKEIFQKYPSFGGVRMGRYSGYAFVTLKEEEAQEAIEALDGQKFKGR
ncbi:MAG: hypothetical protein KVP17_000533 [Porospora cf. gigantea B]|uniref:uncharacterized protein n=1 Tax=Porospora cf. gigantea A TaxID=2853593 RepID=UPI00355AB529|nr:MAG: hypothetical protein KVP17_000533 [Porospora cf. gigantea B]KAH0487560.1 MAG: hypothetical protein KVP18_000469 [Porospora cf. gigantea A]